MHPCIKPIGSAGIFLTAVKSRVCAIWCSEVTDSGIIFKKNDNDKLAVQRRLSEKLYLSAPQRFLFHQNTLATQRAALMNNLLGL